MMPGSLGGKSIYCLGGEKRLLLLLTDSVVAPSPPALSKYGAQGWVASPHPPICGEQWCNEGVGNQGQLMPPTSLYHTHSCTVTPHACTCMTLAPVTAAFGAVQHSRQLGGPISLCLPCSQGEPRYLPSCPNGDGRKPSFNCGNSN